uniref:Uncharacterized protein n=1 Tax=Trichuris muris TaxID=70415 RepID=A0A5S6QD96_TRIMR
MPGSASLNALMTPCCCMHKQTSLVDLFVTEKSVQFASFIDAEKEARNGICGAIGSPLDSSSALVCRLCSQSVGPQLPPLDHPSERRQLSGRTLTRPALVVRPDSLAVEPVIPPTDQRRGNRSNDGRSEELADPLTDCAVGTQALNTDPGEI